MNQRMQNITFCLMRTLKTINDELNIQKELLDGQMEKRKLSMASAESEDVSEQQQAATTNKQLRQIE